MTFQIIGIIIYAKSKFLGLFLYFDNRRKKRQINAQKKGEIIKMTWEQINTIATLIVVIISLSLNIISSFEIKQQWRKIEKLKNNQEIDDL